MQIWQHFGSKYRRLRRFCRLYRLISPVPSIIWLLKHSMAWKRSSVRSRSISVDIRHATDATFTRRESLVLNHCIYGLYNAFAVKAFGTKAALESGRRRNLPVSSLWGHRNDYSLLLFGSPIFDVLSVRMAARSFPFSLHHCKPLLFIYKLFNSTCLVPESTVTEPNNR